jgi:hypothetical protein
MIVTASMAILHVVQGTALDARIARKNFFLRAIPFLYSETILIFSGRFNCPRHARPRARRAYRAQEFLLRAIPFFIF